MKKLAMMFLLGGLGAAAIASPPGGGDFGERHRHRGPPPLHLIIQENADELGLSEETQAQIEAILEASRADHQALRAELEELHEGMKAFMDSEPVDAAAVLSQVASIGAVRTDLEVLRMSVMLDIRALLTPEQWEQLKELRPERPRGQRGGRPGPRPSGEQGWRTPTE